MFCRITQHLLLATTLICMALSAIELKAQSQPKAGKPLKASKQNKSSSAPKMKPEKMKPAKTGANKRAEKPRKLTPEEEQDALKEGDADSTSRWSEMMGLSIRLESRIDAMADKQTTAAQLLKAAAESISGDDLEEAERLVDDAVRLRSEQLEADHHPLVVEAKFQQLELRALQRKLSDGDVMTAAELLQETIWQRRLFQALAYFELEESSYPVHMLPVSSDDLLPVDSYLSSLLSLVRSQSSLQTELAGLECVLNSPKPVLTGIVHKERLKAFTYQRVGDSDSPQEAFLKEWRNKLSDLQSRDETRRNTAKSLQETYARNGIPPRKVDTAADAAEQRKLQEEALTWRQTELRRRKLKPLPGDPDESQIFNTFAEFRAQWHPEWTRGEKNRLERYEFHASRARITFTALDLLGQKSEQAKFIGSPGVSGVISWLRSQGRLPEIPRSDADFARGKNQMAEMRAQMQKQNQIIEQDPHLKELAGRVQTAFRNREQQKYEYLKNELEKELRHRRELDFLQDFRVNVSNWMELMAYARSDENLTPIDEYGGGWVELNDVWQSLPAKSCLIVYQRYGALDPGRPQRPKEDRYVAWIVPEWHSGDEPSLVDLGPAAAIDAAIAALIPELKDAPAKLQDDPEAAAIEIQEHLAAISELVMHPLEAAVGGCSRLIIQPHDELWEVPWSAVLSSEGKYLIESKIVQIIPDARLLTERRQPSNQNLSLVVSDPDYAAQIPVPAATEFERKSIENDRYSRGLLAGNRLRTQELGDKTWSSLSTKLETRACRDALRSLLGEQPAILSGAAATEQGFYQEMAKKPRVVVIATHGFFLTGRKVNVREVYEGRKDVYDPLVNTWGRQAVQTYLESEAYGINSQSDSTNCGIVLAGADHQAESHSDGFDGIVTGYELSQFGFRLRGTDLVVLSACETGLGNRGNGGLRGTLHKNCFIPDVIATLWQVPDAESADLMTEFWRELSSGTDVAEALAHAQRSIIAQHRQNPDRYGDAHPYFWAAYGMSGVSQAFGRDTGDGMP